jgi:hypothetical protein
MRYSVTGRGPYELSEEGRHLVTVGRADDVLYLVYQRCHARLADYLSLGGWVPLHAGMVSVGGRRALVIGGKGSGKTTLMLRLLFDGHRVEGDETVYTRRGMAVCLPRNFHVKPGTAALIPELARLGASARLPATSTSDGMVITGFNPSTAGHPWTIGDGPVDAAFVLHPDHGGTASCRPVDGLRLVEAAVANCFPSTVGTGPVVAACSSLLGDVDGYELTVGDVGSTARLLAAALGG